MALTITCSNCAHTLKAKEELAGKKVMCPKCQAVIAVPALAPTAVKPTGPGARIPGRPWGERAAPAAAAAPAPPPPSLTREQLLAAFHGKIELPRVSLVRKFGALLVLGVLFGLALVYVAMLAAVAWLAYWLATHDFGASIPPAAVSLAMAGAVIALLCLLRPLLMPQQRSHRSYSIQKSHEGVLTEFIAQIGQQLDAPPPAAIQTECSARLTLDRAGRTLTIGLGLVSGLSVQHLAGLVAGHLAQHRRGAASGPTNLIRAINGWMWRSVFQQDRFDQWITRVNLRPGLHLGRLVLPLRYLSFLARAALWIPMFIGNTVAAALVRQTELDADVCSARLIGKQAFLDTVQRVKIVEYTWEGILPEINFLYKEQRLPDSLPHELAARLREMTPELCLTLVQTVITAEEIPFDSRPSEAERLAAVAGEPATGALACPLPASVLWTNFGTLARDESFEYYSALVGAQHLKSALRRVE